MAFFSSCAKTLNITQNGTEGVTVLLNGHSRHGGEDLLPTRQLPQAICEGRPIMAAPQAAMTICHGQHWGVLSISYSQTRIPISELILNRQPHQNKRLWSVSLTLILFIELILSLFLLNKMIISNIYNLYTQKACTLLRELHTQPLRATCLMMLHKWRLCYLHSYEIQGFSLL